MADVTPRLADVTPLRLAVALALAGPWLAGAAGARADEPARGDAMTVSVVRVSNHCFADRRAASGTISARRDIEIRPDRDGLVVNEVSVEAGDHVVKDQVLAKLASAQPNQEPVSVKAPAAGVVIGDGAIIGAYTSPQAGDPLFRIAGDDDLELKAETLAVNLPRLKAGMSAKIHVVGLGDVDGKVAAVDDGVDARTQLGVVHLSIAADPRVRVGGFARAEIDTGQECGLTVPLGALLFGAEGPVIGLVQSNRVVMRSVTTGLLEGGEVEIRDGLIENDLVIARAGPFLREGDHVVPVRNAP